MHEKQQRSYKANSLYLKFVLILIILILGILGRAFPFRSFFETAPNNLQISNANLNDDNFYNSSSSEILDFYNNLNNGNYSAAFKNTIEPQWEKDIYFDKNKNVGNNNVIGIKNNQDLVERSIAELGKNGEKLSIYDIKIINIIKIDYTQNFKNLQDVAIIGKIRAFKEIDSIYIAAVEGQIYSSFCSHSNWYKDLVLIKFKDEEDVKILLNGAKNMIGNSAIEWFINRIVGEYIKI